MISSLVLNIPGILDLKEKAQNSAIPVKIKICTIILNSHNTEHHKVVACSLFLLKKGAHAF